MRASNLHQPAAGRRLGNGLGHAQICQPVCGTDQWRHLALRHGDEVRPLEFQRVVALQGQMAHFIAVARGEVAPLVSAADGLANLRVTEAIAQSAASGGLVLV